MTYQKVGLQEMLASADPFVWLQGWFYAMCDGDWEHGFGPQITTLDNPGWHFDVDLNETGLGNISFDTVFVERTEHDWIRCEISQSHFHAYGGPVNLTEMLTKFREWARPYLEVREYSNIYSNGDEE
ncbi:immunity 53 family protein [Deinococcus radiomollis]|uniref:immunity 53 family protein n=1 Tax=Deinococcus radiomollis TaxID=468916 RepID=UPI003891230F